MPPSAATVSPTEPVEAGKGGERGDFHLTNAEFIAAVFPHRPDGAFAAVCSKSGDPSLGGWSANRADQAANSLSAENNNYVGCSSFYHGTDGSFKARKAQFAACHFLLLDDLGTKVPVDRLDGFELSWLIETSPSNHQGGIILAEPLTDGAAAVRLLNAVINSGLCDPGAAGPLSRWARLPVAINGKPKYADEAGVSFHCRLIEWRPDNRYTPREIVDRLQLELAPAGRPKKTAKPSASSARAAYSIGNDADDVLTPKAAENPVVAALKAGGFTRRRSVLASTTSPVRGCMSIATHWTPALPISNPTSCILLGAFAASTPTATSTTFRPCSKSSVCATLKHGTSQ
jgi:hypothetical protein